MTLPAPLTPPDSDLQDFPFMPLQVARLRDSDLAAEEHPEACWYAVLLWSAAWHQLPAGSLPDNDAVLTKLIGLGRDVKTFAKHRTGALRGFIKCSDGRLYHPIVAEQVLASWEGKLRQRWRTECGRIKKANQRNKTDLPLPTFEEFIRPDYVPTQSPPGSADVPEDVAECPSGQSLQGRETGTETGTERPKEEGYAFSDARDPAPVAANDHPGQSRELALIPPAATPARSKPAKPKPQKFVPEDWQPKQAHAERAAAAGLDLHQQVELFRNHEFRDGKTDFDRTFTTWLINASTRFAARSATARQPGWDPMDQAIAGINFNEDFAA